MQQREPEDATPAEYATTASAGVSAKPSFAERTAPIRWRNFRTRANVVGLRITEDGTEVFARGIAKPHYPLAGARASVEAAGTIMMLRADGYEAAFEIPKGGRKHAHAFAAEFNTWMMNGAHVPAGR